MGHSVGEYVAACVAGLFSLEDGLKLVAARARLMQALPQQGAMVAIFAAEAEVEAVLATYLAKQASTLVSIAAINGPQNVVISGEQGAVQTIAEHFKQQGIKTRTLAVSHAFHSPLMEPMLADFAQVVSQVDFASPPQNAVSSFMVSQRPRLISNVTGECATAEMSTPAYWVRHVSAPVRFADSISTLNHFEYNTLIEIGPEPVLLGMARLASSETSLAISYHPSLRKNKPDWEQMLSTLGKLYVRGIAVDWEAFDQSFQRRKVTLPTYPFQRERYWLKNRPHTQQPAEYLSPLIDTLIRLPHHKEIVCETNCNVARLSFLVDHRVFGKIISPGTCQLAMVLEAAQLAYPQHIPQ